MSTSAPTWWLVTRREVVAKLTDKTFLLGTLATVALIAGFMAIQAFTTGGPDRFTLAATPDSAEMSQAVADNAQAIDDDVRVTLSEVADDEAATAALRAEEADVWLHPTEDGWELTWKSSEDSSFSTVVSAVVTQAVMAENAAAAGTTLEDLQVGAQISTELLEGDAEQALVAEVTGFVFAFLFYLAAMIFGYQLAYSVIEEKQSRIVEIIAAAIPLRHLLAGKILGNTVLALLQMVLYVAVGLIGMLFTPYRDYISDVSGPVVWFLAFFVAGFMALACLWAVAGSLASRNEDVQATGTPLMVLIMGTFFGGLLLEGNYATIGSFVPPLSAVMMPQRLMAGDAAWWEALVALGLLGVFTVVTVWFGERVYRRALMQSGGRVSLRQAWSASD